MVANNLLENYNKRPWSKHSKKPPSQPQPSDKPADDNSTKSVSKVCRDLWLHVFCYRISCWHLKLNMNVVVYHSTGMKRLFKDMVDTIWCKQNITIRCSTEILCLTKRWNKVLPYSLSSVGPRAGPSVQAVSPQCVTLRHPLGGRLPLLSAAVTSVVFIRWRQPYTR